MGNKVAKLRDLYGKFYCKVERTPWEMCWQMEGFTWEMRGGGGGGGRMERSMWEI